MSNNRNVMIYGEIVEGQLTSITKELLSGARHLADELDEELVAVFIGHRVAEPAGEAAAFGADRVVVVDDEKLGYYHPEFYLHSMEILLQKENPRYVLFGHTDVGADLAPCLAFRLGKPVTTDCVEVSIEPETKRLLATKPVYGGLAMALLTSDGPFHLATVRPKSFSPAERKGQVQAPELMDVSFEGVTPRVRVLQKQVEEVEGIKLEDAEVIVSGGRGIGGAEGFRDLEELAKLLKGAVGGSRVASDSGWVLSTHQIGLTGIIVAPSLYMAVGISGASQHMTGCSRSKTIVAINKDPNAPIFKEADYGLVGDWKEVLPAFVNKVKSMME
jgi:electron transfer flavoprotein alpha subunit